MGVGLRLPHVSGRLVSSYGKPLDTTAGSGVLRLAGRPEHLALRLLSTCGLDLTWG